MPIRYPLPAPIGPVSATAVELLSTTSHRASSKLPTLGSDPFDADAQLAWYLLEAAGYGIWAEVPLDRGDGPAVAEAAEQLANWFHHLVDELAPELPGPASSAVATVLGRPGESISGWLAERGTLEQLQDAMLLRLPYQILEADPHTHALPRVRGRAKKALAEIQSGEYGVGHDRTHADLFVDAYEALGLPSVSDALSMLPGHAFATFNVLAAAARHRAKTGQLMGQLALFEMDSVEPNARMVVACERLGVPDRTTWFFQIHVWADSEHGPMAEEAILGWYLEDEPDQASEVLRGIRTQAFIDRASADLAVPAWRAGSTIRTTPHLERVA